MDARRCLIKVYRITLYTEKRGMKMAEIIDTTPTFMEKVQLKGKMTRESLAAYHNQYHEIFDGYFPNHCPKTDERLDAAIEKYPSKIREMEKVIKRLPSIIDSVSVKMSQLLYEDYDIVFRLLVGTFGSNAYVNHSSRVHFAVERLSSQENHLSVIASHELAHAYHFKMLNDIDFDWSKLAWDGFTSLYLEGIATYVSEQIVPSLNESVYLSFDNEGDPWTAFYHENRKDILGALYNDLQKWTMTDEREWFRLSGGKLFGLNRLGYLAGWDFIKHQKKVITDMMTFWNTEDIRPLILEWLESQLGS